MDRMGVMLRTGDRPGGEGDTPASEPIASPRHVLFGIGFDRLTLEQVLGLLTERPPEAPFAVLTTPNVDHVLKTDREPALQVLFERSWLCVNDSRILKAGARHVGRELTLVPGSTLTALLFDRVIRPDEPVTILGCTTDTVARLKQRYGLTAVAHHWPAFGFLDRPEKVRACLDFVRAHPARFTFLAVGFPRQEKLAHLIADAGGATGVGLCIGASLNFLAGEVRRAPLWMQNLSLEWLHRLASEPRRLWRRYLLGAGPFIRLVRRERAAAARARPAPGATDRPGGAPSPRS